MTDEGRLEVVWRDLVGDHGTVASANQAAADNRFGVALTVAFSGIDQGDAEPNARWIVRMNSSTSSDAPTTPGSWARFPVQAPTRQPRTGLIGVFPRYVLHHRGRRVPVHPFTAPAVNP